MAPSPELTEDNLRKSMRSNRWVLWVSRHWLALVLLVLFVYVGLALLAPVLLEAGADGPANLLYRLYSPMCHQFAFRSWFFFGDHLTYPRAAAHSHLPSFDSYAVHDPHFAGINLAQWSAELQVAARSFKGNAEMGYKTALCERDVAIYAAMLLGGLAFTRLRGRLRPVPIWLYLLLGLGPIGLDGFSQLLSYPPFEFWPVRETLPGYRALTGAMFGLMNIWLAFPYMEQSARDTIEAAQHKLALAQQRLDDLRGRGEVV